MAEPTQCPKCGTPLVPAADGPACPRCLLEAGLESGGAAGAAGATAPSPEEMGKHFPQLEILELLGQGGMGIVYKARQRSLDRLVALKVLAPESAREAGFADRFSREARTLARLQHPNIVGVHDFGSVDGLFYLVMDFVDGANLRQAIRAGKLSPREALAIVPQVCDALQYAHDQGVVHRDIKPENILMDGSGRVRIADFGLAKIVQRTPVDMTITRAGQVMGTLHYMAPEQYRTPDSVDHRADIYSLGVVFYEMLTGELPLGSFPMPSSKAGVDVRLDGVVMRALESERDRRWQHASEMKTHVSAIAGGPAAAIPAATAAAAAPAAPSAAQAPAGPPLPEPTLNRWALLGALGVPASFLAGAVGWLLVRPFASGHAATWFGALLMLLTVLAGWVAAIAGWAQVYHDRRRWKGLGWAIAGTFMPMVLFCSGGFILPILVFAGSPSKSPFNLRDRLGGTGLDLPGISIEDGPDGTHVKLPGIDIQDGPGGSRVKMPGIDIQDGHDGSRVMTPGTDAEDPEKVAARVTGGPSSMTSKAKVIVFQGISRLLKEHSRPNNLKGEPRLYGVHLEESGTSGRAVYSDGLTTVSRPIDLKDGGWIWNGETESAPRPPEPGDLDGRLTK
jgi:predicted Ser/Thr protein kinase